jgi:hypothetical protein
MSNKAWWFQASSCQRDSIDISKILFGFSQNEIVKTLRARLLHTLKAHLQVNGKIQAQILVGLNNIDPSEDRTFVITASTTKKLTLLVLNEFEGISVPAVLEQSLDSQINNKPHAFYITDNITTYRLNIVMSINKHGLLGRVVAIGGENNGRKVESAAIMHLLDTNITCLNACTEVLELRDEEL